MKKARRAAYIAAQKADRLEAEAVAAAAKKAAAPDFELPSRAAVEDKKRAVEALKA